MLSRICRPTRSILRHQIRSFNALHGISTVPAPFNEPMKDYAPGSPERTALLEECAKVRSQTIEIPTIINGKEYFTGDIMQQVIPSEHGKVIANVHKCTKELMNEAINGALKAREEWAELPLDDRAAVFLRAADLLSSKYRYKSNAATMIGQGKTIWQAEIDSAAETIDFYRFNAYFAQKLYRTQPLNTPISWNRLEYRPLEGFVAAVSPFNFTAIGSNLCATPAQMGNVVLWKPSKGALLSNYVIYQILKEAGLPDGVIQFVPSDRNVFQDSVFSHPDFTGLHFTGSTGTFNKLWQHIGQNISKYKTYPKIVGETGGKNFALVHTSANVEHTVHNLIRGAFEYQGQKCSATARAYIPKKLWPEVKKRLLEELPKIKVGQPDDPKSFLSAVIDSTSFNNIKGFIERAKQTDACEIMYGGKCDDSTGYFIEPTVIVTKDPLSETMRDEIFGPVLTIYVYDEKDEDSVLKLIDNTAIYALTGSIFARDAKFINKATHALRNSAGNFYINDKSTGAVVGQQPFGGARASGTNDKAGSEFIMARWCSIRTIKENLRELEHWGYPSVDA
jgi:1-pyrroline-5-carboxylate dehydrogenase